MTTEIASEAETSALVQASSELTAWLNAAKDQWPQNEYSLIEAACLLAHEAHSGQTRVSGEPYILHAIAVADILIKLKLDHETIAAALLHDVVEDTDISLNDLSERFGDTVANLVDGVTKLSHIHVFRESSDALSKEGVRAESLRKMLLAMAEDVRVVLIKLADRLHNMRTLSSLPERKQQRIAKETMELFAPLANRLGIWQIKWELEDLSFRYLQPSAYHQIASMLAERRVDRERYIDKFVERLDSELKKLDIKASVKGRPKHIYGIWKKMQRKHKDFDQIYDVRAVRILAEDVRNCYAALGAVHSLWQYIPGEFDDYIATPKENNYRSIHTAVIGDEGKTVEVQIRTHDMHRLSEYGVAAHWRYKEGGHSDHGYDEKIAWLRQLLEWKDELAEAGEFVDQFKSEVFSDRVYVFTPTGNIIDLPQGATPLDFAYRIHTEVGHRCRGARVNGHIVALTYKLKTGEQVEVLTVKKGGPSRDWLNTHLGYLQTSKARSRVQTWFRHQDHEKNVDSGRTSLERELRRVNIIGVSHEQIAQKMGLDKTEDLYAGIGRGDIKTTRLANIAHAMTQQPEAREVSKPEKVRVVPETESTDSICIHGVGNLMTHLARCCRPVPGEPIVGYITRGRGVSIHRRDCTNVLHYTNDASERLIEVNWGGRLRQTYPVDIEVEAYDRSGLLRDISNLLSNEDINVITVNTRTDKHRNIAHMSLTAEIPDIDMLSKVLVKIEQLPNVIEVKRRLN